jgi:tetratricopeptide (TPR) repeat protein
LAYEYFSSGTAIPIDPYTVNSIDYLKNYLRLNPYEPDILSLLASIYLKIKEPEQAIGLYKILLKSEPDNAELNYNLGICDFHMKNYDSAMQHFFKAIKINDHTDSYLYIASIYKLRKDYEKALYYFRERVKRKSGNDDEYARQAMRGIRLVLDKIAEEEILEKKGAKQ